MLATGNEDAAIRRLRPKHCPRWLWIAAVCINQAVEKKNAKVSIILVYTGALE
jgi:hypothetical protein